MFAILELGGKQYKASEKDILRVEKLDAKENETVDCEKVLLVSDSKGTKIGTPYLPNTKVRLKVLGNGRSDKVRIFKMKAKKRYKRLRGHRQPYTDVQVVNISA